jgi:FixJ family two-component response regulator
MSTTQPEPKVFLVDDDPGMRDSIRMLMKSVGLPLVSYATAQEFLAGYDPEHAGCLLLDVRMPGMSGLELLQMMPARGIHLPVIILTGHADVPMAVRAMKGGAVEFLEKPFNDQLLLDRIHQAVASNLKYRERLAERNAMAARVALLTPRERQVLELLMAGKANKTIALELGISRKTLDIHRSKIMQKMEAESLTDLVRLGMIATQEL